MAARHERGYSGAPWLAALSRHALPLARLARLMNVDLANATLCIHLPGEARGCSPVLQSSRPVGLPVLLTGLAVRRRQLSPGRAGGKLTSRPAGDGTSKG